MPWSRLQRAALTLALCLLAAALLPAAASAREKCPTPKGAKVDRRTSTTIIFKRKGQFTACWRSTGAKTSLGGAYTNQFASGTTTAAVLVDRYAGFIRHDTLPGGFETPDRLVVQDLKTGKNLYVESLTLGESIGNLETWFLGFRGIAAWVMEDEGQRALFVRDGETPRELDRCTGCTLNRLTVGKTTVVWDHDGVRRSAPLMP